MAENKPSARFKQKFTEQNSSQYYNIKDLFKTQKLYKFREKGFVFLIKFLKIRHAM